MTASQDAIDQAAIEHKIGELTTRLHTETLTSMQIRAIEYHIAELELTRMALCLA
jgi:hypothetical protein